MLKSGASELKRIGTATRSRSVLVRRASLYRTVLVWGACCIAALATLWGPASAQAQDLACADIDTTPATVTSGDELGFQGGPDDLDDHVRQ